VLSQKHLLSLSSGLLAQNKDILLLEFPTQEEKLVYSLLGDEINYTFITRGHLNFMKILNLWKIFRTKMLTNQLSLQL